MVFDFTAELKTWDRELYIRLTITNRILNVSLNRLIAIYEAFVSGLKRKTAKSGRFSCGRSCFGRTEKIVWISKRCSLEIRFIIAHVEQNIIILLLT